MKSMQHKIIKIYKTDAGKSPFNDWLNNLKDPITRARVRRRLDRLEIGNYGDCKSIKNGIYELRLLLALAIEFILLS